MQLQREAVLPLLVGHLEEIDLRHRAGDVEQRVDPAEGGQGLIDHGLRGRGLGQIGIDDQRLRAGGFHRLGRLFEMAAVARDEDQRRKVARETDGGRPTDALAGAGDDGD